MERVLRNLPSQVLRNLSSQVLKHMQRHQLEVMHLLLLRPMLALLPRMKKQQSMYKVDEPLQKLNPIHLVVD